MPKINNEIGKSTFILAKNSLNDNVELIVSPSSFQVGLKDSPSDMTLMGRLSCSAGIFQDASSSEIADGKIILDSSVTVALIKTPARVRVDVYLPTNPRNGQIIWIKDRDGTATSVNPIMIKSENFLIDGSSSTVINSAYGTKCLCWCDDMWSIIS